MPRLSIITICYNDKAGLEKTMQSVLNQSWQQFEYIVVDGGSKDGSAEVIQKYAERLAFSVSEKDKGIYNAQNKGWKQAGGDYCLFLNSGDILASPQTLSEIFATAFEADLVYGDLLVDNGKDPVYRLGQPQVISFDDLVFGTLFHPATLIRRELLVKRDGYDESYKIAGDYDFFLEAIFKNKVTTTYLGVPFAIFNTAGIGSNPANAKLLAEERRRAQLKLFSEAEIAEAEKRALKKMPRSVRLRKSVEGIPVIESVTDFALRIFKR